MTDSLMAARMAVRMVHTRADTMVYLNASKMVDLMANWRVESSDGQGVEKRAD